MKPPWTRPAKQGQRNSASSADRSFQPALNQVVQHLMGGAVDSALQAAQALAQQHPHNPEAWHVLGIACIENRQFEAAIEHLQRAIGLHAANAAYHYHLGIALYESGQHEESIAAYQRCLTLEPKNQKALDNLCAALQKADRLEEALDTAHQSLQLQPNNAVGYNNLASLCLKLQRLDECLEAARRAIEIDPLLAEARTTRASALIQKGAYSEAISEVDFALQLTPNKSDFLIVKALALGSSRNFQAALDCYEQIEKIDPNNHNARHNQSLFLLSNEHFDRGFELYENRFLYDNAPPKLITESATKWVPGWHCEKLLIWQEQGIGDMIFYASALKFIGQVAQSVTVVVDRRLIPLLQRSFPLLRFIELGQPIDPGSYDAHAPIADIAAHFFKHPEFIADRLGGYLSSDTQLRNRIRAHYAADRPLCGITWSSGNNQIGDKKSIPLSGWLPVLQSMNASFVSLQYGDTQADRQALLQEHGIEILEHPGIDNFQDIDAHAALIDACDCLFLVSNTSAHIAGALGKTTYMVQAHATGRLWYWKNTRGKQSLWYPSITLYAE